MMEFVINTTEEAAELNGPFLLPSGASTAGKFPVKLKKSVPGVYVPSRGRS
jgi:hypothetical protein